MEGGGLWRPGVGGAVLRRLVRAAVRRLLGPQPHVRASADARPRARRHARASSSSTRDGRDLVDAREGEGHGDSDAARRAPAEQRWAPPGQP